MKLRVSGLWVDVGNVIELLNHPGHADQKSHGRKKSGGDHEVRDALAGAGTIGAISRAAAAEAKRITGRDILFEMDGSDPQTAREHAEGVLQGLERFPAANLGRVSVARLGPTTYAHADGNTIVFNSTYASRAGRAEYLKSLAVDVRGWDEGLQVYGISALKMSGFHTRNSGSPTAVALHEFGHVMDIATTHRRSGPRVDEIVQRATKREQAKQTVPGSPVSGSGDLVLRTVSGYAMTNRTELIAEAFTDVMVNGSGASSVSRDIFGVLEDSYNASHGR